MLQISYFLTLWLGISCVRTTEEYLRLYRVEGEIIDTINEGANHPPCPIVRPRRTRTIYIGRDFLFRTADEERPSRPGPIYHR